MKYFEETRNLFDNSKFFYVIILGMDGNYSYVSKNYDQNFSFTGDTLLGKPFHISLHPDDIKICEEVANKCFQESGRLFPATLRKHDGKGGYIITQWELKALLNHENRPDGIFCTGYNVTEYFVAKQALNEIGFINSHLIRKPLANILGLAGILSNMEMDINLATIINMIVESADELDREVKRINFKTE